MFNLMETVYLALPITDWRESQVNRGPAWLSGGVGSSRTGALRGSVVEWVRAALDPLGFFRGNVLGQDTSEPKPSTGETQERLEKCELSP